MRVGACLERWVGSWKLSLLSCAAGPFAKAELTGVDTWMGGSIHRLAVATQSVRASFTRFLVELSMVPLNIVFLLHTFKLDITCTLSRFEQHELAMHWTRVLRLHSTVRPIRISCNCYAAWCWQHRIPEWDREPDLHLQCTKHVSLRRLADSWAVQVCCKKSMWPAG